MANGPDDLIIKMAAEQQAARRPVMEAAWAAFAAAALNPDSPPEQRRMMRVAFYAGAWQILETLMAVDTPAASEAEGLRLLAAMRRDCLAFHRDVAAGLA